jgi:hypothetical protein
MKCVPKQELRHELGGELRHEVNCLNWFPSSCLGT